MSIDRSRVTAALDAHDLEALVATSPENVTWSTGYTNWTIYTFKDLEVYAVIPRSGELALVVPIDALDYIAQRPPDTSNLYTYGTFFTSTAAGANLQGSEARLMELREQARHYPSAVEALQHALADQGVESGTIGLDERGLPPARWRALESQLSATVVEANECFRELRVIKTAPEVEQLRMAARAAEAGMRAMFEDAAPGLTEADLEVRYRTVVAANGATPGHFETSAGTRSAGCFPASSEYRIQQGDVIRSDTGARYFGYWADTGRTAAVGEIPATLLRYYDALRQGIEAMLAVIKPGLPVSELFEIGVETVRRAGIPHYQRHHVGHGIGLEMYEAPLLVGAHGRTDIHAIGRTDRVLEEGMVINIELPYYEFGLGGLQIEDTLVVRPDGSELLTQASREMYRSPVPA